MSETYNILLLEDEPLILMDLEMAAEDLGCTVHSTTTAEAALSLIEQHDEELDVAILDVSLGGGKTCVPVANALKQVGIPFILHSADLDRHNERIRELDAELIAKPAPSDKVIEIALSRIDPRSGASMRLAAE